MAATTLDVVDTTGKKAGSVELPGAIFDVQTNVPLIHQVVTAQLAAARQGTHSTKGRGEVSGSGAKPFKQKGTGRARQGSVRMPQHTGGGIVHGPTPRDYGQRTRWYDLAPSKGVNGRDQLTALFRAAERHDCYVILSSWEYQQSSSMSASGVVRASEEMSEFGAWRWNSLTLCITECALIRCSLEIPATNSAT